ncbi:hypothetical protein AVEN_26796-1 [Araneus ventricosus]|uniref:Tc1-like transposase DDE domain-containing protein n=1 Tax=Araneus ventricosus TaxID=182803 RepID=A0A4Y2SC97_ARAVE|nr:hypothetical protein AVEN_26796-1 [Araneus ventricosus]
MNKHVYFNILDDQVLPFSQHLQVEYALVTRIFQDDHSTVHRAGIICDWFDEHSHTLLHLDWPAKSPDLNPIEICGTCWNSGQNAEIRIPAIWWICAIKSSASGFNWMRRTCRILWTRFLTKSRRYQVQRRSYTVLNDAFHISLG